MKKIFNTIFIFIMLTIISLFTTNEVKADFPTLGTISEGGSGQYNGYDFLHFKKGTSYAVFCTKFHLETPAGHSCTLNNDWSEPVQAGVATIIKDAGASNSGISTNYYYAELAINEFLYYYNGKNTNNRVSSSRSVSAILGNHSNYYTDAVSAYNKVKSGADVGISLSSGKSTWTINSETTSTDPTNIYKITTDNVTSSTVTVSATTAIPKDVVVKIYTSSDGSTYKDTNKTLTSSTSSQDITKDNYVKVVLSGVSDLTDKKTIKIKINVKGTLSYNVAANYTCGSGYQTVTPNYVEASNVSDTANATFTVKTVDVPDYPNLKIVKTDKNDNQKKLSKAYYKITLNGNNVTTKYTNDSGEMLYDELEEGTYCVQETKAPSGYFLDSTSHCFDLSMDSTSTSNKIKFESKDSSISYNEENSLITISLTDEPNKVNLGKVDVDGNYIKGATLKLTTTNDINAEAFVLNGEKLEWVSTTSAKVIKGLPAGTYYLFETVAPDGYVLNPNPEVVQVSATTKTEKTITLEDNRNTVSIRKVDITDKQELAGATLRILDKDGNIVTLDGKKLEWTSGTTAKKIVGLPAGTYYLEETQAPTGYKLLTEKIKFSIDVYGAVTVENTKSKDATVVMNNEPYKVYISKKDLTSGDELPGAHLQIIDKDGKIVEEWDSTNEIHLVETKLPVGTYTLKETIAPEGYVLSQEEITFSVDEYGVVTVDDKETKDSMVIMTNDYTKVYISKQDITTKKELAGAHLILKNENGDIVKDGDWISGEEPHLIEGLSKGTYTLTEITAPDGYQLNEESITFTIDEYGVVTGDTVMYNTPIPDVPSTSSSYSIFIIIGGVILVGAGIGLYIYGIKKTKK